MNQTTVKEKIRTLETQIQRLKAAVFSEPDYDIDEYNWKKIRPIAQKIRKKLYKKYYGKG